MAEPKPGIHRDPMTGEEDEHQVGMAGGMFAGGAVGGAAGAALGAAAGTVAGPAGTVVGAIVGGVAGGLAGKEVADRLSPSSEDLHWRTNFARRPYATAGSRYEDFEPAYRMGYERRQRYTGRPFDELEPEFERDWDRERGDSKLSWAEVRHAARDAFERVGDTTERLMPGDSDRDGR